MIRSWRIWIAVSACLCLALAGVVWLSAFALRLDRADRQARESAAREENARLALWRLDSDLLPLVARESAVAAEAYDSVSPARGVLDSRRRPMPEGTVFLASPLLSRLPEHVLLHFQLAPDGTVSSPQVVEPGLRDTVGAALPVEDATVLEDRLQELTALLRGTDLRRALAEPPLQTRRAEARTEPANTLADISQVAKNVSEYSARSRSANQAVRQSQGMSNSNVYPDVFPEADAPLPTEEGDVMRAVWVGDTLLLGRRVRLEGQEYIQGCWLDWPGLRTWLLGQIRDLLPSAVLEPVRGREAQGDGRMLAALPVRLVPGQAPEGGYGTASISSLPVVLTVAWSGVLLAGVAVVALLVGVVALSERRGAFVSAVTHELRTPLTTFRMYTEMLAAGMVPDEARRQEYFDILHREAERLSHLVENVLAYARIERGRAPARLERVPVDAMLERMEERLAQRAAQADMELCVDVPSGVAVLTDPSAVEQVLFNLVDNASKYAAPAVDRRIHVELEQRRGRVGLSVRDHGPGVDAATARRLFEPFSKSVQTAAKTAPGVGLGLALCRRLARSMRADLRYERMSEGGARFVLWLPSA
ncbi:sensor histidine kinase [Pyxidicoccus trucidator]|uniref:sensor histidine kinase n=1 Tax=Pyxidicoccus trucidator TaxID=2709662 RepID=UPI0013DD3A94|nr:HAMP domain-containing sensor histidine kinase [Pyxidicoccus trucidator]